MLIAKTISEIRSQLAKERINGKKIALVPTMGALHAGHLALVKKACELSKTVVVSIFINKAQFNNLDDYEKYPKQIEQDLKYLRNNGVTHVFLPRDNEIFPDEISFQLVPLKLTDSLCAGIRAGHFEAVGLVIFKLFNIIKPDIAIFGEKDFQQLLIVKRLVADFNFDIKIFSCPVMRQQDGLAESSRNQKLCQASKIKAASIFHILTEIRDEIKNLTKTNADIQKTAGKIAEILQKKREKLLKAGFEKIDYLEIRDEKNLGLVANFADNKPARLFIAVYLDGVRLIDNIPLEFAR
jgi:pantoate--beta-alanine ligase